MFSTHVGIARKLCSNIIRDFLEESFYLEQYLFFSFSGDPLEEYHRKLETFLHPHEHMK